MIIEYIYIYIEYFSKFRLSKVKDQPAGGQAAAEDQQ